MSQTVAICGKGGVGKTTVSALIARHLARAGAPATLVVDADHAAGLSVALGLEAPATLNDIRVETLRELKSHARSRRADLVQSVDYRLLAALAEHRNLAFLALGRPDEEGCFCPVQNTLRQALRLLSSRFDLILVDAEAGVEQINREALGTADTLLLVADGSIKALRVAETIRDVALRQKSAHRAVMLLNRVRDPATVDAVRARTDLELVGFLPEDEQVHRFDAEARPFFELPPCPATAALDSLLDRLGIVGRDDDV